MGTELYFFLDRAQRPAKRDCALDDGFGNVTEQNVITRKRKQRPAPTMHVVYNASLFPARRTTDLRLCTGINRQTGDTADANGNLGSGYTYDIPNRLIQAAGTTMKYAYAADNKRVWRGDGTLDEIDYWNPAGQK